MLDSGRPRKDVCPRLAPVGRQALKWMEGLSARTQGKEAFAVHPLEKVVVVGLPQIKGAKLLFEANGASRIPYARMSSQPLHSDPKGGLSQGP